MFCLQEVSVNLAKKIGIYLPDYAKVENRDSGSIFYKNQITFVKKILAFKSVSESYILVCLTDIKLSIINIHSEALPGHKLDTKKRIEFVEEVLKFTKNNNNTIIGGDFNLMPRTKCIKIFEENNLINLIKKSNIKKTRNRHAWEQAKNLSKELGHKFYGNQRFADYCFVSKGIKVKSFEVPNIEISDHLPLILEFEV
ncbi:MAG: hypothetical protein Q8O84_05450 [Nanoarchaeota archaeon]|nr:hypothetical protein [Nanoarchaeota archaeon]